MIKSKFEVAFVEYLHGRNVIIGRLLPFGQVLMRKGKTITRLMRTFGKRPLRGFLFERKREDIVLSAAKNADLTGLSRGFHEKQCKICRLQPIEEIASKR